MPINQPMKSMVSGLNIHVIKSYAIVLKPNTQIENNAKLMPKVLISRTRCHIK
jgi:hypothetical protein